MARVKTTELNVIKSDTDTAPTGSEWRGEYYQWGDKQKKVFVETFENAEVRAIIDPTTGGPMYKRGAGGVTLNSKMTERVVLGHGEREFILVDFGNGQVGKQYTFRETPEEIERRAKAARRQANLEKLLDLAEEGGGIEKLLADEPAKPAKKQKDAA